MELSSLFGSILDRIRLSSLFPGLAIALEATVKLCTGEHIPIFVLGGPPAPPAPLHVDVTLRIWNRGQHPITVFEVLPGEAAGQVLVPDQPGYLGAFEEVTLEVGGRRSEQRVRLRPPEGQPLAAQAGDRLRFTLKVSRGRPRRATMRISGTD